MSKWFCGVPPSRPPPVETAKASVSQQHSCIVSLTGICSAEDVNGDNRERGIGVIIHPTLILTTHSTIPSPSCVKDAEIIFCRDIATLSYIKRKFMPEIFFQTDADLDLTVVSCEIIALELDTLALDTTKLSRRALRKGHTVFVMGCQVKEPGDIVILEGKIAGLEKADRLSTHFRFQTGDGLWMPGSAGFDKFGTFCFIVTKPRKIQDKEALTGSERAKGALFSSKHPKQWASCIQVVKDWVEPLWRKNRDEVFQGLQPTVDRAAPAVLAEDGVKTPSLQGDSIPMQKSIILRTCVVPSTVTTPIWQATRQGTKDAKSLPTKPETAPTLPPQKLEEKSKTTTKTVAVETDVHKDPISDFERYSPKNAKATRRIAGKKPPDEAAIRQQRGKREALTAMKKNKGLKRLADKATRTTAHETDSVSVQTELFVTDADVKPMIIVSRPESPDGALRPRDLGGGRKGQRERWSLPADGHGLDFMRGEGESLPLSPNQWGPSMGHYVGRSVSMKEADSAPSWMDKYYARGRTRSERPSRSSSAGTTPPRPRRQVVSDAEADLDCDDSTSISGSSLRSLQHAESVYFKPTISYMQKRNLNQRDSILARQASQTTLPRWS